MTELQAINLMLLTAGEAEVLDLTDPNAQYAKTPLAFAIAELPYDSSDFALDFESLPSLIQTYVLTRATRKFQLSVVGSAEYLVYSEVDEILAKKNILINDMVPNSITKAVTDKLKALFGYAVDAENVTSDFYQYVKLLAAYTFQTSWVPKDYYSISIEEVTMMEEDFRVSLIAARVLPQEVLDAEADKFVSVYGYLPTEITNDILEHIRLTAAYKAQSSLIRTKERYPILAQDIDNSEAGLLTKLILPKKLIADISSVVRAEFELDDLIPLTIDTQYYILIKVAYSWQFSVIRYATKLPYSERDVLRAKSKALNSLGATSLLESPSVSRVITRDSNPEITTFGTTEEVL